MQPTKPDVTIPAGDPPTKLLIEDLIVGDGPEATAGKNVDVHYVGVVVEHRQAVRRLLGPRRHVRLPASAPARSSRAGTRAWPGMKARRPPPPHHPAGARLRRRRRRRRDQARTRPWSSSSTCSPSADAARAAPVHPGADHGAGSRSPSVARPAPTSGSASTIPTRSAPGSFDVTFLLSPWTCIFGQGCQGVLTGPDARAGAGLLLLRRPLHRPRRRATRSAAAAAASPPTQWQFQAASGGAPSWQTDADGDRVTRQVDDACIFLNRPGFGRRPRLRPPRRRPRRRRATPRLEAQRVLAAPPAPGGRDRRRRPRHLDRPAVGPRATGATAAPSSTGGAPRPRGAFVGDEPSTRPSATSWSS